MPFDDKVLQNWLERFERLHPKNKEHIKNAIQKNNIIFTTEEQVEDFLHICEMFDVLFRFNEAE